MSGRQPILDYLDSLTPATQTFVLRRHRDVSGVSGTGVVADGAIFPDGRTVTRWRDTAGVQQTCVWDDVRHVQKIHGHGGDTAIETVPIGDLIRIVRDVIAGCDCQCCELISLEIAELIRREATLGGDTR